MAELLFATAGSKGKFKSLGNSKFKLVLKGVDERLTWFTDRPDRDAGSLTFNNLISQWDDGFQGVNPNSALLFKDRNGENDTVVFEQSKPRYNADKEKLTFRLKIHNKQKLDLVTGALQDEAADADGKFTKTFSDFSLFIDNWFSKDTSVNFINDTNDPIRLVRLKYDASPNWKNIVEGAMKVGAQWNYGYDQRAFDYTKDLKWDRNGKLIKPRNGWGELKGKQVVATFKDTAKSAIINTLASVGADLIFPTATATPRYDEITFIGPGESYRITDVDTQFGVSNGVKDVGVIAGRAVESPADFVTLAFDNPMVGYPKGYIKPLAVEFDKAVTSTEQVYIPEDPKTSSFNLLNGVDQVSIQYFGDIDLPDGSSAKGWDVHFQNL